MGCYLVEDEEKQEEKFDFTPEGEAFGYVSLDQARVLAMRTAREAPGDYGRRFRSVPMAFDVTEANETEDYYEVTLSVRPQGSFTGTPGQEQFFIEKEGAVAIRQVLALPRLAGVRWSPVVLVAIGLVGVVIAVAIGVGLTARGGGGDQISPAVPLLTSTPRPPATSVPLAGSIPTGVPTSTAEALPVESVAGISTSERRPIGTTDVSVSWFYPVSADSPLEWIPPDRDVIIGLETGSVDRVIGLRFHVLPEIPRLPAGYVPSGVQFKLVVHPDHDSDPIPYTFIKPLTLTVNLRASDVRAAGGVESNLVIQRYHEGGQGWEPLATVVDLAGATAMAEVDRLSIFALTFKTRVRIAISEPTPIPLTVPTVTPAPTVAPSSTLTSLTVATPTPTGVPSGGLIRGATISVRVTDADTGLPIVDVDIAAGPKGVQDSNHIYRAKTDDNGYFILTGLRKGIIEIHSDDTQGYIGNMDRTVTVGLGEVVNGFNYSLRRGAAITGRVIDVDPGLPISGLRLNASEVGGGPGFENVGAGEDGRYTLGGLTPGIYIVTAEGAGRGYILELYDGAHARDDAVPIVLTGTQTVEGIDFALKRGATISGTVRDAETGLPIANMDVKATFADWDELTRGLETDIEGRFALRGLPDGVIEVIVAGQGYLQTSKTVTIRDGQDVTDFDF